MRRENARSGEERGVVAAHANDMRTGSRGAVEIAIDISARHGKGTWTSIIENYGEAITPWDIGCPEPVHGVKQEAR